MQLVMLSGGVGGARMARGLAATPEVTLTVVVNVADDDLIHGLHVSADVDTVVYTLAGIEGPDGWGRNEETWTAMEELSQLPAADTSFRLGDRDLAVNLYRTGRLLRGDPLSDITRDVCDGLGVRSSVLPATDDPVRTMVATTAGEFDFQTYFVRRRHTDAVTGISFRGLDEAAPAPGVLEAIEGADAVVIAPSNPILSIWPILGVRGIRESVRSAPVVVAVSPLIGGKAVKGPAAEVMPALGFEPTISGVAAAYGDLVTHLVIDASETDQPPSGVEVLRTETMMPSKPESIRLAQEVVKWIR
ncbi:MAG: 2-phospho-L-lactate transferase [Acidimicrobiia bacterium]|nr:2-phospho-L-lactate transferase [Acidimicrobiia bacterium]MDH5292474.1 2-phospho-L-lactate transferase [Acidimicrobiia bacterium]